jgi:uncharacterized repeat protein (TIGR03803 family)
VKAGIKTLFLLPALAAGFVWSLPCSVSAQTFTTLHHFTTLSGPLATNKDGAFPQDQLILSGNTLYGTASQGGYWGDGTVFAVSTSGTGFTNLYSFSAYGTNAAGSYTNTDGANPNAGLILSGNTLYGSALNGGTNGTGTVFALGTNSTGFALLHAFAASAYPPGSSTLTNADGANPLESLTPSGNTLYGTATGGGVNGNGTVFSLNTNGTAFTNLYTFSPESLDTQSIQFTNGDGAEPNNVILSGNTLYGTAYAGGTNGSGTLFALGANGTGFTLLHAFAVTGYDQNDNTTNGDGAFPENGLTLSGDTLYGTAELGGTNGNGAVFALNTNGTGFTLLHVFAAGTNNAESDFTNSDGDSPFSALVLSGNTLYGTTTGGGVNGSGTVFALNTNGTGFNTLHAFSNRAPDGLGEFTNSDGYGPNNGLIISGNTLYGTAAGGGTNGSGTVFSILLTPAAPQLAITRSGTNVLLTWPTAFTGYTLAFATNLTPATAWNTNLPKPVTISAQNVVTNGVSGMQRFYRLSQ